MTSGAPAQSEPVTWTGRLSFGVGSYAEGLKSGAFAFILLFYYNQVLGLPGSLAGAALAVALVIDAISDPLVGSLSDRFRSRWGRRHPFMYAAAVPYALVFYLLFVPPAGLGQTGLFAWMLCFSVATRFLLTFYSVPHMALAAELSQDYDERTRLSSLRALLSILGMGSVILGGFAFFLAGDAQFERASYPPFALTAAVLMAVTILLSAVGTHAYIPRLLGPPQVDGAFSARRLLREMGHAISVRQFRLLLGTMVAFAALNGMLASLATYLMTYFFRLEGAALGIQLAISMVGGLVGAVLVNPVTARLGSKRNTLIAALLWFGFFSPLMVNLRLLGWAPENGDPLLAPMLLAGGFLSGWGMGGFMVLMTAMVADITDEHERVHGTRHEGIYFSAVSFVSKATSGLGTLLAGLAIDFVGLDPSVAPDAAPAASIWGLGFIYGPLKMLLMLFPVALILPYDIDRARHEAILGEIAASKAARSGTG